MYKVIAIQPETLFDQGLKRVKEIVSDSLPVVLSAVPQMLSVVLYLLLRNYVWSLLRHVPSEQVCVPYACNTPDKSTLSTIALTGPDGPSFKVLGEGFFGESPYTSAVISPFCEPKSIFDLCVDRVNHFKMGDRDRCLGYMTSYFQSVNKLTPEHLQHYLDRGHLIVQETCMPKLVFDGVFSGRFPKDLSLETMVCATGTNGSFMFSEGSLFCPSIYHQINTILYTHRDTVLPLTGVDSTRIELVRRA